jgi:signal transduction histidine kinase/DNA-binding response OmpR family regulator
VNNLFEDSRKNIWFCTESGLCRYDYKEKKIIRSSAEPVLRDNQVFRVMEDNRGMLWVSTSKGLINLNPVNGQTKSFNTGNGLLSDQFNYNSACKDEDGTMYFGTVKGMIGFNPAGFVENSFIPPVYITGIQVNNGELKIDSLHSRLRQSVIYTSSITLPYDSSTISIDVSALSYAMPDRNEYLYRMDGLDKNWNHLNSNGKIYYTKLSPGNYVFNVKGSAGGEVWNSRVTRLSIHILPPWWASFWAWVLYALVSLSIIFVILRYYYIALREKNKRRIETLEIEKEREIYNAKIDFFTNITHEIRTPLTLIKLPVEKLLKSASSDSAVRDNLNMIDKNTNRLIHLTNQLLDFRKAEANNYSLNFVKTDINDLLKELFATYKPAAEERKLSFKLELPRIALLAYVDAEAFRKILGNLFSNAIKYASQSVVIKLLPFNSYDNVFHIEFKNDGSLIPGEAREKIFEPFYRLRQSEKHTGTGIGLPLSRSLAELHKGKLELKQPVDGQNVFLLSIPIHQENEISLGEYETIESDIRQAQAGGGSQAGDQHDISILIAEDNMEIVNFLQKELGSLYNIYTASDGQAALGILLEKHIHLVISDIMMPVMDGIELSRKMKTDLQFSHIPIILLTAKNSITSKIEGLETGADAYIEKPFVMEYLLAQISNLLSNRNIMKEYYAHSPLAHIKGIASTKADKSFLEKLHQAIDENIADKDLDVDSLSKMMNMSRVTFYRKIKGLSDLTPNELINLSRLKKAAELLAEGRYMINEVASIIGYNLTSNFSRDFHKQFGVTPSGYVKSLQKES